MKKDFKDKNIQEGYLGNEKGTLLTLKYSSFFDHDYQRQIFIKDANKKMVEGWIKDAINIKSKTWYYTDSQIKNNPIQIE